LDVPGSSDPNESGYGSESLIQTLTVNSTIKLYFQTANIDPYSFSLVLISVYILCLDFVAQAVYGGQPDAPPGSVYDILFDEGVRMGSWGLLLHSITGQRFPPLGITGYQVHTHPAAWISS
jgi:hypothetical protein